MVTANRIGTMHCECCGAPFNTSGCVIGFACDCPRVGPDGSILNANCMRCHKCTKHCQCPEGFLTYQEWRAGIVKKYPELKEMPEG